MKRALTVLLAGVAALAATSLSAQNISAGNATGLTTGGATTPAQVPVTFTRNAAAPVADFTARVTYNNTVFTATAAGANGGSCSANQASGFITVLPPPGGTDTPTNVYCNITFTVNAAVAANSYPLTPTVSFAGGGCFDSTATAVACTLTPGAIVVSAPAGNVGPNIAYAPAAGAAAGTGGPVNFTGVTTVGSTGAGQIVATPSGGTGAGTTTVGSFTLSGAGAASFAVTSAATLTFTAGTVTAQNINLTCTAGGAPITANLQATETIQGGATSQRFWVLNCPAGSAAAVPPTLTYNPAPGSSNNVAAGAPLTIAVGCPTDGANCTGSGTGLAATSRLESLSATYAGPMFSPLPTMVCAFVTEGGVPTGGNTLDFVALAADPGDIRCTCPLNTTGLPTEPFTVVVGERSPASGSVVTNRSFTIVCGAPPPVCGTATYVNQAPGATINLTNGGAASPVSTVSLVGASNGVSQTISCATSNVSAGSTFTVTTNPTPLVISTNPALGGSISAACTNTAETTGTATLTCTGASTTQGCQSTTTFTLSCPGQSAPPPPSEFVPVPALNEQGRILLAALVLLMGLGVVGFRMRG